jgi:predicted AlkP superfamily phosphohydrolase/phosphomutase
MTDDANGLATEVAGRRVLVVGLDGASFELLGQWMDAGLMPNLAALVARGVAGGLESVIPPLTPPAWTSAVTGVNPGRHGVLNFAKPRFGGQLVDFYSALDRRAPALWDFLGAMGKRSVILHLPATHPPLPLEGLLVSGIPVTDLRADCSYPKTLKDELIAAIPGYKLFPNTLRLRQDRDLYFRDTVDTLRSQAEEALYLMRREPWDLFFTLWQVGDSLMHFFWRDMDGRTGNETRRHYIREFYKAADEELGRVVAAAGPETHVIVMSDHGHTGVYGAVYLNKWLADRKLLKFRVSMNDAVQMILKKIQRKLGRKVGFRKKYDPEADQGLQIAARMLEKLEKGIEWSHTVAHAEPPGYIWINAKDRYPRGIVEPGEEYLRVREEIRAGLGELVDPDSGEPVLDRIVTREDAFAGPGMADAPDLVVTCKPGFITEYAVRKNFVVGPSQGARFSGYHVMRGMLAMAGPEVRAGESIEGAAIVDVAPTILHLLDLPVQPGLDGAVLERALTEDAVAARPVRVSEIPVAFVPPAAGDFERSSIEQSLRDLGYL